MAGTSLLLSPKEMPNEFLKRSNLYLLWFPGPELPNEFQHQFLLYFFYRFKTLFHSEQISENKHHRKPIPQVFFMYVMFLRGGVLDTPEGGKDTTFGKYSWILTVWEIFIPVWENISNTLSFLSLFFFEKARKPTKKTRIFYPYRTPKIPGKEGKNAQKNKEILAGEKNKKFQENKERKDRVLKKNLAVWPRPRFLRWRPFPH